MKFTLALAQCIHPDDGDAVSLCADRFATARAAGADLLVFPESMMTRYEIPRDEFLAAAQPLDGPYARALDGLAARHGIWAVYSMNERNPAGGNPFNTAVVVDSRGRKRGVYRKAHLFDTDFTRESDRMSAGSELLAPVEAPFGRIGVGICYDLRFPELARWQAVRGCSLLVYPAAWVAGAGKVRQWETLLAARAIENGIFVAGVSRADAGYIGNSRVFGPDGAPIASGGDGEELVVAAVDLDEIRRVRAAMPVLDHRRPALYGSLDAPAS